MLEEKIAVVTGASRGIGRAIAKELALKGAFVIVNYNGSKQAADETVNEITQAGGKAVGVQCNVADAAECEAFINNIISEYGPLTLSSTTRFAPASFNAKDASCTSLVRPVITI